ncbi:hypothetical protein J0H58_34450 [bacterium]|nr:hypothetical protein [bacterium]
MPLTDADAARLDDYRFQHGPDAGNLSQVLDQLTDAIVAVNQHLVYYRLEHGQRTTPPPDLAAILAVLTDSKALVQETLLRLKTPS